MVISKLNIIAYLKLIRIHQWSKNILIFLPLIIVKEFNLKIILENLTLFIVFSIFVSSTYIINDILDIENDRTHKNKRKRPLASKQISFRSAGILFIFLFIAAISYILLFYTKDILIFFLLYFLISICYSKYLKQIVIIDIFILTLFYIFRIFLGGHFNNIEISNWLLFFSFFFFFTIGITKRITELKSQSKARGYNRDDENFLKNLSISSSFCSVLILMLYIQSPSFLIYYNENQFFFVVPLIILFWLLRILNLSIKNKISHDPVLFVIKDKLTYFLFGICLIILF